VGFRVLIAGPLTGVLDQSACWGDLAASSSIAVMTAQRAGDQDAEAHAERSLGGAFARLGRYDDAYLHLRRCLDQFTRLDNPDGQARAHLNLACLLHAMDDSRQALAHARRARELFELPGQQRAGLAAALNTAGWFEASLGEAGAGLAYCEQALALAEEIGSPVLAAATWDSLGYVRHLLGQHDRAVSCYQRAALMFAELGADWYRAQVLINLGDAYEAAGDRQAARELWLEALPVFEQHHHPETSRVRARLAVPAAQEQAGTTSRVSRA
jgi:tetratricopeptide (TPR) repeat protein